MPKPSVLISGAGIAGPALAYWLTRAGYEVALVEIHDGIRPGGQTVDLRGAGRAVIERMGLLDAMRARSLDQRGMRWVKADGRVRAQMPVDAFHGNGMVSQLEILRGDLADVLYQVTAADADYRFGTRITELAQADGAVAATLSDGTTVHADLVVGADGPHSAVRALAFGPEEKFVKPLGGYHAWFTAPDTVGLGGWCQMYQAPGGLNASMRPSHDPATAKAGLAFRSEPLDYDRRDLDEQRELLAARFAGVGWQSDALIAAARRAEDFYFDAFAQVHMDNWSSGRVTLVGDAGYCASPLSGMGTSLALVGAYVLAGELGPADDAGRAAARGGDGQSDLGPADDAGRATARGGDAKGLAAALDRYHTVMRPYVDRCQTLGNTVDRYAPNSAADIAITAAVMKYIQRWPFRIFAERKWFTTADAVDLPDYPASA